MKIVKPVLASLIMVLIIGCASKEPTLPPEPIPEWISSPSTENGWVATGCVPSTANLANDMNSADLEAKYQIASSLRTHIQSATGRQLSVVDRNGRQISSHDSFDDKSKLIVDEELIGTRRIRGEYISIEGRRFFCSKVHFDGQIQVRRIVETAPSPEQPEIIDTLGSSCSNPFAWTAAASLKLVSLATLRVQLLRLDTEVM